MLRGVIARALRFVFRFLDAGPARRAAMVAELLRRDVDRDRAQ